MTRSRGRTWEAASSDTSRIAAAQTPSAAWPPDSVSSARESGDERDDEPRGDVDRDVDQRRARPRAGETCRRRAKLGHRAELEHLTPGQVRDEVRDEPDARGVAEWKILAPCEHDAAPGLDQHRVGREHDERTTARSITHRGWSVDGWSVARNVCPLSDERAPDEPENDRRDDDLRGEPALYFGERAMAER